MKRIIAIFLALCLFCLTGCSIGGNKNNFKFTDENYPKTAAALSAEDLAKAIAATAVGRTRTEVDSLITLSGTTADAYKALCDEKVDIVIAYEPDTQALAYIKESGKDIDMTPIATDALVMICSGDNEVDSLTENQIAGIYSGRIRSWKEVGGSDTEVMPYQCKDGSAEQELFTRTLNLGDRLKAATKDVLVDSTGQFLSASAKYDNGKGAIGYAVYHKLQLDKAAGEKFSTVKTLMIDGVAATDETIESGEYTLTENIYVAVRKDSLTGSAARVLYNWICSDQGKELIGNEGYKLYTK